MPPRLSSESSDTEKSGELIICTLYGSGGREGGLGKIRIDMDLQVTHLSISDITFPSRESVSNLPHYDSVVLLLNFNYCKVMIP